MKIALVSSVRLFRDCLAASLKDTPSRPELTTEADVPALFNRTPEEKPDVVVVDVTQGTDLDAVRALAAKWHNIPLLALGLLERRDDVISHGRAGFVGYIARDASIVDLQQVVNDAVAGRLQCPAEISGGLIRALFRRHDRALSKPDPNLTGREADVLNLVGQGYSNKEIARNLGVSVATVKCHVHNMFGKLGIGHRAEAIRRVRATPWIGSKR